MNMRSGKSRRIYLHRGGTGRRRAAHGLGHPEQPLDVVARATRARSINQWELRLRLSIVRGRVIGLAWLSSQARLPRPRVLVRHRCRFAAVFAGPQGSRRSNDGASAPAYARLGEPPAGPLGDAIAGGLGSARTSPRLLDAEWLITLPPRCAISELLATQLESARG